MELSTTDYISTIQLPSPTQPSAFRQTVGDRLWLEPIVACTAHPKTDTLLQPHSVERITRTVQPASPSVSGNSHAFPSRSYL
jgi:hypothetical protein